MKSLVGFSLLFIIGLQIISIDGGKLSIAELAAMIERIAHAKCQKKTGASLEQIAAARKGEFPEDRQLMCYYKCILEKMKMMKDNKLQYEYSRQQVKAMMAEDLQETLLGMVDNCWPKMTKTEPCELAYQGITCWYNSGPQYFFF